MIFIILLSSFLLIMNIIIWYGLHKLFSDIPVSNPTEPVSVIIAARNEEKNINNLLYNIDKQRFCPAETIIVDDYSTDDTFEIASGSNTKVIGNYYPQGKKNALTAGINAASSSLILITDADCLPEEKWTESFSSKFSNGCDLLFGIAPFIQKSSSFINKISCFENLRSFILSVSAVYYKLPYSAAARNFGFRKDAFIKLKGYRGTMEVPYGDDGLLIREAVKHNMSIGFVNAPGSSVYSHTKFTLKEYLNQRRRHISTSFHYSLKSRVILACWHIPNLLSLLFAILTPFNYGFCIPLILKLTLDSALIYFFQKKFGYSFSILRSIMHQILYELFIIIHFFNAMRTKPDWK